MTLCCRFYQHASVQKLNEAVLERVGAPQDVRCAIFPSEDGMTRCSQYLRSNENNRHPIREVSFHLAHDASTENATWARFSAALYPEPCTQYAEEFWGFMGDGISSRHAEFCLERLPFMESVSSDPFLRTCGTVNNAETLPPAPWGLSDAGMKTEIKSMIAKCVTSEEPDQEVVTTQDTFLYPKGMCAVGAVARALAPTSPNSSEAVIFG